MLVGIVNTKENDYYIHIDNNTLDIIEVGPRLIKHLNKDEIVKLISSTLASKIRFKEHSNGYDIYLDEAGNKRYFKDGEENYKLLLLNNGIDAVCYNEGDENLPLIKKILFKNKQKTVKVLVSIMVISIISDGILLYICTKKDKVADQLYMDTYGTLTYDKVESLIEEANNLTKEEKEFLCNNDLLNDIINCSLYSYSEEEKDELLRRNYELYQGFQDINIKIFPVGDKEALGYYTATEPNRIYICEVINTPDNYYNVLAHEYIHLLQLNGMYPYISETCAEIISSEYFDVPVDAYQEEIKRTKVLMEIINPESLFKYNFKKNDTSFVDEIKKYLSEEDTEELLKLFNTTPKDWTNEDNKGKENNEKIDKLLAKMYLNKTNEDISTNPMITAIYNNNAMSMTPNRIYFNKHHEKYYKDYVIEFNNEKVMPISLDEVLDKELSIGYKYYKTIVVTEEEKQELDIDNIVSESIVFQPIEGVEINTDTETGVMTFKKDGKIYSQNEAIDNKILIKKKEIILYEQTFLFDRDKAINADYISVSLRDGTIAEYKYLTYKNDFETIDRYKYERIIYPSISKCYDEILPNINENEEFSKYLKEERHI